MSPRAGAGSRFRRLVFPASSLERLADTLPTFRHELTLLIHATTEGKHHPRWAVEAEELLELAEQSIRDGNSERAWRSFLTVLRLELHGLRDLGREEFRARAASIRAECLQKLRSWRRAHAEELFRAAAARDHAGPVSDAEFAAANEAARLLHEHFGNETLKQRAGRSQTIVLVTVSLLAVGLWLAVSLAGPLNWNGPADFGARRLMVSALLFGSMGAAFSALISLAGQSAAQTIPEQALTYRITLARQVVGMLSALAVYVLLTTGFLKVGNSEITTQLVLLAAFAAGFSERLVVRALERFAGAADGAKTPESGRALSGRRSDR